MNDKLWEKIGQEAIRKAEGINCGFGSFVYGLEVITEMFKDRLSMAQEELKSRREQGKDDD